MGMHNKVIPIYAFGESGPGRPSELARALLHEIAQALDVYVQSGRPKVINVSGLRLSEPEREVFNDVMGKGEVSAQITADGRSQVEETRFPGVWCVRHYDAEGALQGEWIEVTDVPEIVKADITDMTLGLKNLRDSWS